MEGRGLELAPGLHRIEAPLGERFVACYLIVGGDAALLVDTGVEATPPGSILPYADSIGLAPERIRWIVVTHCDVDHMGGNAAAAELLPQATVVAHEDDVELIEDVERIVNERYSEFARQHGIDIDDEMKSWCRQVARAAPVDLRVTGLGETIRLGGDRLVELTATPGHSPGSLSVWDPPNRAAIVGDAVLGSSVRLADGRPAFPPTYRQLEDYRWTLTQLETYRPQFLLTSHDPVMEGDAANAFLDESRAFTHHLERELLASLADGRGRTTRQLIDELAPKLGEWPQQAWQFLAFPLLGHLEDLASDGLLAATSGQDGILSWRVVR
jgi:glyoxylase-like metal-dependent hydrolase (beta-lactamase superfamily II)